MSRLRSSIWLIFVAVILLSGCVTQRRCAQKFPLQDSIAYRDTVYFVTLKTDTVREVSYIRDTVYASTGTAGGAAWVIGDTIYLNVWQKDTIIAYRDSIQTVYRQQIVEVPCKKTPVLNKFIVIGILLFGIVLVLKFR